MEKHKNNLCLGKRLAIEFAGRAIPDAIGQAQDTFAHRGAYARFKDLLQSRGKLEEWFKYETEVQKQALRKWCEANKIKTAG